MRSAISFPAEVVEAVYQIDPTLAEMNVEVFVDSEFLDDLAKLLADPKLAKKFRRILYVMLRASYDEDLYGREAVSDKAKFITAMKFKGKFNLRIYCKEFFRGGKKIVLIFAFHKKTQKINKQLRDKLEAIGSYEYKF